ncbi:MAG TPA: FtsX-like permease family protein [Anaerolineaceae bacterium]|jgi:putative ABC transport system permease protein
MTLLTLQLTLAARYLFGRKLRTLLTTLAVTFGVMLIFGMNGIIPTFLETFERGMLANADKADLTLTNEVGAPFDQQAVDTVRSTPGIAAAAGSLQRSVALPQIDSLPTRVGSPLLSISVMGVDPPTETQVHPVKLSSGRFLQAAGKNEMVISDSLAGETGLALGSTLVLPSAEGSTNFHIVGMVSGGTQPGPIDVFITLADAQRIFNLPNQINAIDAMVQPRVNSAQVTGAVLTRLGSHFRLGLPGPSIALYSSIQLAIAAFNLFGLLALIMGGFIIFNTFRTVVTERRRDIGMLRALGATRGMITGLFLTESLLQGIFGTALGMLAGYTMLVAMEGLLQPIYEFFIHGILGKPIFSTGSVILSISLGVGISVLAGLLPAIAASRITPLEALRPESSLANPHRRNRIVLSLALLGVSAVCMLTPTLHAAPLGTVLYVIALMIASSVLVGPVAQIFGRLIALRFAREGTIAQGNVQRQPDRAAITASAVLVSMAVVIALFGLITTIRVAFTTYLEKSLGSDYLLIPQSLVLSNGNVGASPELISRVRAIPGIGLATSLRVASAKVNGQDMQVVGIDPQSFPQVSNLEFKAGDEPTAYRKLQNGDAIIVNGIFAAQYHVSVGDTIAILTAEGERPFAVTGIGMDYMNAKLATVYLSQANLAQYFNVADDRLIMADRRPGADRVQTEAAMQVLAAQYPAFKLYTAAAWQASQTQALDTTTSLFYILILVLALPSLVALMNTLGINVLERTREIGVLRAVGATRTQVRRMILIESLLLAVLGTGLGILAGVWLGYMLVQALNVGGFVMSYYFPYLGVTLTVGIGLVFGVLAALIPARQAARLEIVSALHAE